MCRQTLSRTTLDPYLVQRLLSERGAEQLDGVTVQNRWDAAGADEMARRAILLTQMESLRIRRGVVGRYFDEERVVLRWLPAGGGGHADLAGCCEAPDTLYEPPLVGPLRHTGEL
jgi:hypothetical protein